MNYLIRIAVISISILLSGCLPDYTKIPSSDYARNVKVKDTKFDAHISYVAPEIRYRENYVTDVYFDYLLRGWKDKKTGSISHQLYVEIHYTEKEYIPSSFKEEDKIKIIQHANDWRVYRTANFENATRTHLVSIDTDVDCQLRDIIYECDYKEMIGVPITSELLKRSTVAGFTIRLNSKSGHESFITVPANYIQGYINASL